MHILASQSRVDANTTAWPWYSHQPWAMLYNRFAVSWEMVKPDKFSTAELVI